MPAVHIRMAVGAFVAHIGEDQFRMALRAGDGFMHAAQRIAGLVVIEFGTPRIGVQPFTVWQFWQGIERLPWGLRVLS